MKRKIIIFIIFFIFVSLLGKINAFKENSAFEMHQKETEQLEHAHKYSKKARITQQQKFELHDFFGSLKETASSVANFISDLFNSLILRKPKTVQKSSIVYRENFASQNGGAQILMVSSSRIKSPKAILRNQPDAYLFTADVLPITIVIGLKEQILIDSFAIQSGEVYSCITQDFMLEGAFSLQNEEWVLLGNFTAENSFETQQFAVEQKIIRYIKLTILSSFGTWKYFTLSQVKVYGEGLFSHAMQSLLQSEYTSQVNNSTGQGHKSNTSKKQDKQKVDKKHFQTKQILVQAFEQLVVEGKEDSATQKHKHYFLSKQTSQNAFTTEDSKANESHRVQKSSSKQKKSISILKKKISYLEKRNFEMNIELKELKKLTEQKFFNIQTDHKHEPGHRNHQAEKWYEFLLTAQSVIVLSMIINITCLVLVGMVFKNKILSRSVNRSTSIAHPNSEENMMKESFTTKFLIKDEEKEKIN